MAGPGSNLTGTRNRRTLINLRSKSGSPQQYPGQTPPIFVPPKPPVPTGSPGAPAGSPTSPAGGGGGGGGGPLLQPTATSQNPSALAIASPGDYGSYAATIAGLEQQLAGAAALAKSGIGTARAQYGMDMDAARQGVISGVTGAESSALQSGSVGSSSDLSNRAAAVAAGGTAKEEAAIARAQAISQQRAGLITATGAYYTGLGEAQSTLANAEAQAAITRFQQGLYDQWAATVKKLQRGRRRDATLAANSGQGSVGSTQDFSAGVQGNQGPVTYTTPPAVPTYAPPSADAGQRRKFGYGSGGQGF
jgi:hypothetical protein